MNKNVILGAIVSAAVYFFLTYSGISDKMMAKVFRGGSAEFETCVHEMTGVMANMAFIWTAGGVPDAQAEVAHRDAAQGVCRCTQQHAQGSLIAFLNDQNNSAIVKECSKTSTEATIAKYGEPGNEE